MTFEGLVVSDRTGYRVYVPDANIHSAPVEFIKHRGILKINHNKSIVGCIEGHSLGLAWSQEPFHLHRGYLVNGRIIGPAWIWKNLKNGSHKGLSVGGISGRFRSHNQRNQPDRSPAILGGGGELMSILNELKSRVEKNRRQKQKEKESGVKRFVDNKEVSEKELQEYRTLQPYVAEVNARRAKEFAEISTSESLLRKHQYEVQESDLSEPIDKKNKLNAVIQKEARQLYEQKKEKDRQQAKLEVQIAVTARPALEEAMKALPVIKELPQDHRYSELKYHGERFFSELEHVVEGMKALEESK